MRGERFGYDVWLAVTVCHVTFESNPMRADKQAIDRISNHASMLKRNDD